MHSLLVMCFLSELWIVRPVRNNQQTRVLLALWTAKKFLLKKSPKSLAHRGAYDTVDDHIDFIEHMSQTPVGIAPQSRSFSRVWDLYFKMKCSILKEELFKPLSNRSATRNVTVVEHFLEAYVCDGSSCPYSSLS